MKKYIAATRPSLLAYAQTEQTVNLLRLANPDCIFEIATFSTHGDRVTDKPLTSFGSTGVFVKELENAILEGKADFAIHSLKDVPGIQPSALMLASFPEREDPRDVILVNNNLNYRDLPPKSIIGTGSPRRILQASTLLKEPVFKDIRGNINTRLSKLNEGLYDAIILAAAGLKRLGVAFPENSALPVKQFIPAIGQGALALECKTEDHDTIKMLRSINHLETEISVSAERAFMKRIGGGCKFPLAAYATITGIIINLDVLTGDHHTKQYVTFQSHGNINEAAKIGIEAAEYLIKEAAAKGIIIGS